MMLCVVLLLDRCMNSVPDNRKSEHSLDGFQFAFMDGICIFDR